MIARVKWFDSEKGIGFIILKEKTDAIVHYSNIKTEGNKNLSTGDLVKFDLIKTLKGYNAINVIKM